MRKLNDLYLHAKKRAKERYDFELSRKDFQIISKRIRHKQIGDVLFMYRDIDSVRNEHWLVNYNKEWFWTVYDVDFKHIVSFMPLDQMWYKRFKMSKGMRTFLEEKGLI